MDIGRLVHTGLVLHGVQCSFNSCYPQSSAHLRNTILLYINNLNFLRPSNYNEGSGMGIIIIILSNLKPGGREWEWDSGIIIILVLIDRPYFVGNCY